MVRSHFRSLMAMAVVAVALGACGGSSSSTANTTTTTVRPALRRSVIVPLTIASRYFADLTQEQSTGANPSAPDKPMGTRIVIYANDDGSKKVTLSVDQYASPAEAFSAYAQAVKGSEAAPGAKPTAAPKLGQRSFAGTSQVGSEMHFGLGAVDNRLIVAATYAGYPVTPDFSAKLEALAGQELMVAKQTLASSGSS